MRSYSWLLEELGPVAASHGSRGATCIWAVGLSAVNVNIIKCWLVVLLTTLINSNLFGMKQNLTKICSIGVKPRTRMSLCYVTCFGLKHSFAIPFTGMTENHLFFRTAKHQPGQLLSKVVCPMSCSFLAILIVLVKWRKACLCWDR